MKKQRTDRSNTGADVGANVGADAGAHVGANAGALVGAHTSVGANVGTNVVTTAPASAPTSEPTTEPTSAPASICAQYGDYRYLPGNCHLVLQFLLSRYEVGSEFPIQSADIARNLSKNSESIRRSLAQLVDEGLLVKEAIRKGFFQGLKVQLLPSCLAYQQQQMRGEVPTSAPTSATAFGPTSAPTRAPTSAPAKHIEEEEDINSYLLLGAHPVMALSDAELCERYPLLFSYGFTSKTFQEIARDACRAGVSTSQLVRSLPYAEFFLGNPPLLDPKGGAVRYPYNYLHYIFSNRGFFPRPAEYVCPEEQLLKQLEEDKRKAEAARIKLEDMRYESWKKSLSDAEKSEISSKHKHGPKDSWLKYYFKTHVESPSLKDPIATSTHEQFDHGPLVQTGYTEQSNGKHNGFN